MSVRLKSLSEKAKKDGFDELGEYVLHSEMADTIKKVRSSLDRAFILEDVNFVPVLITSEDKKKKNLD